MPKRNATTLISNPYSIFNVKGTPEHESEPYLLHFSAKRSAHFPVPPSRCHWQKILHFQRVSNGGKTGREWIDRRLPSPFFQQGVTATCCVGSSVHIKVATRKLRWRERLVKWRGWS